MRRFIAMAVLTAFAAIPAWAADAPASQKAAKPAVAAKSMDPRNGSFHRVHTKKLKLACDTCHSKELTDVLFLRASEVAGQKPGPVDRATCAGCHQSPSKPAWYGPAK